MSIETWKQEFYSVTAQECASQNKDNPLAVVQHSLTKWRGLYEENTAKHGIKYTQHYLVQLHPEKKQEWWIRAFLIDADSCSLCQASKVDFEVLCERCPIVQITGTECDRQYNNSSNSPEQMIRLLESVEEGLIDEQKQAYRYKELGKVE